MHSYFWFARTYSRGQDETRQLGPSGNGMINVHQALDPRSLVASPVHIPGSVSLPEHVRYP